MVGFSKYELNNKLLGNLIVNLLWNEFPQNQMSRALKFKI